MSLFPLKPTHKPVIAYYAALAQFHQHGHKTEGNTRSAFADLLKKCASPYDWHLVEEYQFKGTNKQPLRADGALVDELTLVHGLWEAKDTADDLQKEITSKVAAGYPLTNILFQSPDRAVLYQDNRIALDCDLTKPENLIEVLQLFFEHRQPHEVDWEEAVLKFSEKIPDLAGGVTKILEAEHKKNADFREKFQAFADLCRQSINPDLTDPAIQKMLVQHLLTERIFRKVFNNQEFLSRNIIAAEIEKVIHSITAKHFSRDTFLKPLDRFYKAIEEAALTQTGYTEKQHFLNAVYEKFFQSFDKKQSDTHGIVYTPQPIVDFMVRSVEEILKSEFGKSLSDEGVHILDPFTGTGNFITRIMQDIRKSRLPNKYTHELHCNEIMLLPYYIASMNIEHAYSEAIGQYRSFEGICLVDTFDLAESSQPSLFTAENTARVMRQKANPIKVIIGNPPYNVGQKRENDNNKNRVYPILNRSIADTYGKASNASSVSKLDNPYVKAIRWATDRIGSSGVVALITEVGFLHQHAFDGMRSCLAKDFDSIYILDLAGDVTTYPQYSGSLHNVFGIKLGVSINLFVRRVGSEKRSAEIKYAALPPSWKKHERFKFLEIHPSASKIEWTVLKPDNRNTWLTASLQSDFECFLAISSDGIETQPQSVFACSSLGTNTNRDSWAYNFSCNSLSHNVSAMLDTYHVEAIRWSLRDRNKRISPDDFFLNDERKIKWSSTLKQAAQRNEQLPFSAENIRPSLYRPFTKTFQYFAPNFTHRRSRQQLNFPNVGTENRLIIVSTYGRAPFATFVSAAIPDINFYVEPVKTFPFYTYDEDGTNRQENITDWALDQYRAHYKSKSITKWDIFHSTYALLHHPEYRTRYAANLKRELPRIPFPPELPIFAAAGKRLMELHIDYEQQPEYPLEEIEQPGKPWTLRVEKMSLSKDKTELRYNEALTLRGIPPAAFDYRLGNRSALDWIIDQYRVSTDSRSGITNDPNREEDERYILRLIGQVITVSLETQKIIATLPSLNFPT
jgi:predicted helicase